MVPRVMGCAAISVMIALLLSGSTVALRTLTDEEVTLTITAQGLPSPAQARVFINGTQVQDLLSSSSPVVLRLQKGVTISIGVEERVEGQFGFLYMRKSVTLADSGSPVSVLTLASDTNIVATFESSHTLLQPIFWPLYGLVIATTFLILVRRWARKASSQQDAH